MSSNYYFLQILGGIWADRFGGKVVLGFGVVWWSIATMLTPVAAKLGLPFLLIVRAFMGIGEVHVFNCHSTLFMLATYTTNTLKCRLKFCIFY
jgi:MFS family permease